MGRLDNIKKTDPKIYELIKKELERQREGLEMIPSENSTSLSVMEAVGSVLTNKYSEGYPFKRYYPGNRVIDDIEAEAIERAKKLFSVPHANVQAYSGSPANVEVYLAVCKPGDTIMGMNLTDGGHLTHGWKTSATGQIFKSVPYHVKEDGYIDIEEARQLARENKPKIIWIGATAYSRQLPFKEFSEIAEECGAYLAADISHVAGLVVAGQHESPVPYAHIIMTTTHKTLRGPRGALIMVTDKGIEKDPELPSKIDKSVFPGMQGGPHDHTTAGIAIALFEASKSEFKEYGAQIVRNAKALAEELKANGVKLVTDGTENHLILIDLRNHGNGKGVFVQDALDYIGITANKNTVPKETASPFYPSGLRLGTPSLTTRGMKEKEMKEIGKIMAQTIMEVKDYELPEDKEARSEYLRKFREDITKGVKLQELRKQVSELCKRFPLYPELEI